MKENTRPSWDFDDGRISSIFLNGSRVPRVEYIEGKVSVESRSGVTRTDRFEVNKLEERRRRTSGDERNNEDEKHRTNTSFVKLGALKLMDDVHIMSHDAFA